MDNNKLVKLGFIKDENDSMFKQLFYNGVNIKEIFIDVYFNNPCNNTYLPELLLRTDEENVSVSNDDINFTINKKDKYSTCMASILLNKMTNKYFKVNKDSFDFIFNYQNLYYKITVFK